MKEYEHQMQIEGVSLIVTSAAQLNAEIVHADNAPSKALALIHRIEVDLADLKKDLRLEAELHDLNHVPQSEAKDYAPDTCSICDGNGIVYDDTLRPCSCTGYAAFSS